jgi:hypothetical protein
MTEQGASRPKPPPAKVGFLTHAAILGLAVLSALFTITLLGSFSGKKPAAGVIQTR